MQKSLSKEQIEEIRKNYTGRIGEIGELVEKYQVSRSTIYRVIRPEGTEAERQQRRKYMSENYKYPERYSFRLTVDPIKEPDVYNKLLSVEKTGNIGARQHYIKQLIKKDIQNTKNFDE